MLRFKALNAPSDFPDGGFKALKGSFGSTEAPFNALKGAFYFSEALFKTQKGSYILPKEADACTDRLSADSDHDARRSAPQERAHAAP